MSDRTKLQEAAARLGAPHCENCGTLGAFRAVVTVDLTAVTIVGDADDLRPNHGFCSASCAVAFLNESVAGTARSATRKKNYVIAVKRPGKAVGVFKRGREALEAEKRRVARLASRAG